MNKTDNERKKYLSDEDIIELYWEREEKAIKHTDEKYGRYLFTIAYNIVHDRLDSEECLNDTYLGVWNRIPPTRPKMFQVFLSKITRNISVDKYRANIGKKQIPSELLTSLDELDDCIELSSDAHEEAIARELSGILNDFLRDITEEDQFVFVCRYYYFDKISEIAEMAKTSESTVYRILNKLRADLKARLEKEGIEV